MYNTKEDLLLQSSNIVTFQTLTLLDQLEFSLCILDFGICFDIAVSQNKLKHQDYIGLFYPFVHSCFVFYCQVFQKRHCFQLFQHS